MVVAPALVTDWLPRTAKVPAVPHDTVLAVTPVPMQATMAAVKNTFRVVCVVIFSSFHEHPVGDAYYC
jgi:hypothetical protein